MEWNVNGLQTRKSAKTFSWQTAQQKADAIAKTYHAELGLGPAPAKAKCVEEAIALFLNSEQGEDLSSNTIYKHKPTLKRLQEFCDKTGVFFVKDITLAHLTTWRGPAGLSSSRWLSGAGKSASRHFSSSRPLPGLRC